MKKYIAGISPDNLDSLIDTSSLSSKDIAEPKSPSSNSISSNSSSDKDSDKVSHPVRGNAYCYIFLVINCNRIAHLNVCSSLSFLAFQKQHFAADLEVDKLTAKKIKLQVCFCFTFMKILEIYTIFCNSLFLYKNETVCGSVFLILTFFCIEGLGCSFELVVVDFAVFSIMH